MAESIHSIMGFLSQSMEILPFRKRIPPLKGAEASAGAANRAGAEAEAAASVAVFPLGSGSRDFAEKFCCQTTMGLWDSSRLLLLVVLLFNGLQCTPASALKKPYIVYLGSHSHGLNPTSAETDSVTNSHYNLLGSLLGSTEKAKESIFYSYTRQINGFAALLEERQAESIAKHPQVISVFPSRGYKLHTTRSWEFMRMEKRGAIPLQSIWKKARFGEDTIIANIDTGVWPESKSFSDKGMGPVPPRWRGICQHNTTDGIVCNRKLIGARYFNKGYNAFVGNASVFNTVRDFEGHGTHTLSTAGGSFVDGANVFGQGNGTAKGGSPRARVVAYKACGPPVDSHECFDADILAAYDAAIGDGVDVISMSLGGDPAPFFQDGIAIGSFHAVRNGITVVSSAGNSGPSASTVSNISPWMITVAASTIDREFTNYVSIGPNKHFKGASLSAKALPEEKFYPIVRAADAKLPDASESEADLCKPGTLDPKKVKGKILICLRGDNPRVDKGQNAALAGAVGMVLANDESNENDVTADPHVLPASHITYKDGQTLYAYMKSTKAPMAYLTRTRTVLGTKPAPYITSFSSRGPSTVEEGILKPDITAPGANIIAAYTEGAGPTGLPFDKRRAPFITMSGTSMSCPHVAGIVGLLKTMYPRWSPAAIKSAIMTTAVHRDNRNGTILDASFKRATPFDYGSGHVRPNRAMDPGLVYDISTNDYLNFLCAEGYNSTMLKYFTNGNYKCPKGARVADLNYPSITVHDLGDKGAVVNRRVKNVGPPGTYKSRVRAPLGVSVTVSPAVLMFKKTGEERSFKVFLKPNRAGEPVDYVFGELLWGDGKKHIVRSPISVKHI